MKSGDQLEFGIEMLGSVETYGFTYLHFEGQNIHDRKLWIQKLNEAIKNYKDKADLDKSKKESGKDEYVFFKKVIIQGVR